MSIGNPQSFNLYSYVQNDPVNFVDPSGLTLAVINDFDCQVAWSLWSGGGSPIGDGSIRGFAEFLPGCVTDIPDPAGGGVGGGGGGVGGGVDAPEKSDKSDDKEKKCRELERRIQEIRNELAQRTDELSRNEHNLPATGPMSVGGYQQQFQNKQVELRSKINEFNSKGCGGRLPPDTWRYATMPLPSPRTGPVPIPRLPVPVRPSIPLVLPLPLIIIKCILFNDCGGSGNRRA